MSHTNLIDFYFILFFLVGNFNLRTQIHFAMLYTYYIIYYIYYDSKTHPAKQTAIRYSTTSAVLIKLAYQGWDSSPR